MPGEPVPTGILGRPGGAAASGWADRVLEHGVVPLASGAAFRGKVLGHARHARRPGTTAGAGARLGSDSGSWRPVRALLSTEREVIAVDLPGHGGTPPLEVNTIATFADALQVFLADSGLTGAADLAGSSVGARLVLELARRGHGGAVVALDPGGFWDDVGARYLGWTLGASVRAVRALDRFLPSLTANPMTRSALLVQLSARPWRLSHELALAELRKFAGTGVFAEVLHDLVHGPRQGGMPARPRTGW